tara:strand:+ start:3851 stop:4774 length:924 start_codon:yes stop_codon:yes gene_type:complete
MKKLPIKTKAYEYLEEDFQKWLDILGYSKQTIYSLPIHLRELFYYLENTAEITQLKHLESNHLQDYFERLKSRENTRGGGLSSAYLEKHKQAIYLFLDYLRQKTTYNLTIKLDVLSKQESEIEFLTSYEIKELFEATYINIQKPELEHLLLRDRAILILYYTCELRRNEGVQLNIEDINFDKQYIHVKHGKGYKERKVPIHEKNLMYLAEYLYDCRPLLTKPISKDAFLLSMRGTRMNGQSILLRLKQTIQKTNDYQIKERKVGLHTLRHSIATHLLKSGMDIYQISQFLGHSSLESTQIYTHLAEL